ncbi:signal peptide peptidase SppA [Prolixibacteraceae bacterium JC049]|jgi:protease-4|nr:signal peptide peptidase SppA [Prolixibacteraceae bacterium JC049]
MKSFLKFTLASIVGIILASVLLFFIFVGIVSSIASSKDDPTSVKNNSVLSIKLKSLVVDRAEKNPFEDLDLPGLNNTSKIGLNDILKNIEKAKKDDRIKGIYINTTGVAAGYASIEEIRDALIDFKKSEKFIYSYSDVYTQKAYYLASVADSIIMNPEGMFELKGLAGGVTFYKDVMKKVGVEMQVIRHGKFKSAVEPFLRNNMSEANREQTETFIGSIWNHVVKGIASARNIEIAQINKLADAGISFQEPTVALSNKLVDNLKYKDQVLDDLRALTGTKAKKPINSVSLSSYTSAVVPGKKKLHKDKIAIVYAEGGIDSGSDGINSDKISKAIRKARLDTTVKAVVLRINSPGGSALGSDIMWREVVLTKKEKPIIASYGNVSASGGYYMSCAADMIIASPTTITGSIGVFGMIPNVEKLMEDKIGIHTDVVKTNKHSDFPTINRSMTAYERQLMQTSVENTYDTFISHVSEGRKMTKDAVDKIGQGRVWSGENAIGIGLIDEFGGLNRAIELAKEKAGLEQFRVIELPKQKDPIEELLKDFGANAKSMIMKSYMGEAYQYLQMVEKARNMKGVQAAMPYELTIY